MTKNTKTCSFPGCGRSGNLVKNLCKSHYNQLLAGKPLTAFAYRRPQGMSLQDAADWILSRCVKTGSGCLEWQGATTAAGGYGNITLHGKSISTHRIVLEAKHGPPLIPGLQSRHSCDNPVCCNPDHLCWGTQQENGIDRAMRGRRGGNGNPTLTVEQVAEIKRRLRAGETCRVLGPEFGVHENTIGKIKNERTWAWV